MTPHDAFLAAICDSPDDDTPRLMYADWLEERGDVRGEFIREQVELARLPPGETKARALRTRVGEILLAYGRAWHAALPALDGITWADEFTNGFVETVTADSVEVFLRHAPAIFTAAPVRRLNVRRAGAADVVALAGSRHLARLRTLDLHGNAIGLGGARALASSEPFASVRELFLYACHLGDDGVRTLLRLRHPERLRELFLGNNQLTDTAPKIIADAGLTSLVELDLRDNDIGDRGVRALANSSNMAGLVTLQLVNNCVGDSGARALADSPHLGRLRELLLRYNDVGNAGAEALARSPRLTQLGLLDLGYNRVGEAGAVALAASGRLERIYELTLIGNLVTRDTRTVLRERFGVRVHV